MGYWSEIRNDFFETSPDILPEEGDVLAKISIDAWKTADDNEEGTVIACVILSKRGDVLVDYRDGVARIDKMAQEAIGEAKERLWDYFADLQEVQEDLNDIKNEKILYFGEGHFVTREALQEMAVAAAEDFISKVNKPNGKRDSKHSFTYDFGSPFDEMDMYCGYEREGENRGWWTSCVLYAKGQEAHAEASAMLSVQTTTVVNDIADTFMELIEDELDCQIEIEFVEDIRLKMEELDKGLSLNEKLDDANAHVDRESLVEGNGLGREDFME